MAYTSTTRPRPAASTDFRMDITGVIPLPAANSRKSPSSERGLNVPAGGSRSSTVPAATRSTDPVRREPAVRPLDRDGRPFAGQGRARQRVAPGHRTSPVRRHAHRDELPRPVAERRRQRRRHVQHQRARLVGLADHLRHRHLVVLAGQGGDTSSRPAATAASMLSRRLAHPSTSALGRPSAAEAAELRARPHRRRAPLHRGVLRAELRHQHRRAAPRARHGAQGSVPLVPSAGRTRRPLARGHQPQTLARCCRARFSATSASQPATARVVSISNSNRATMSGSMSATSQ